MTISPQKRNKIQIMSIPTKQILDALFHLSEEELLSIKALTIALLTNISQKKEAEKLREEIKLSGFAVSYEKCDLGSEYDHVIAPYYVSLVAYDKEDKSDAEINEEYDTQPFWVEELCVQYEPTGKEDFEDLDNWDYRDWDDPAIGKGKINLHLYCKKEDVKKYQSVIDGHELSD